MTAAAPSLLTADDLHWFEDALTAWQCGDFVGTLEGLNAAVAHFTQASAALEADPVAVEPYVCRDCERGYCNGGAPAAAKGEPVAWMWNQGGQLVEFSPPTEFNAWKWTPLYTAPPTDALPADRGTVGEQARAESAVDAFLKAQADGDSLFACVSAAIDAEHPAPVSDGPFGTFYTCNHCHGTGVTNAPREAVAMPCGMLDPFEALDAPKSSPIEALARRLTKMADDCEQTEDAENGKDGTFVPVCSGFVYDDLIEAASLLRDRAGAEDLRAAIKDVLVFTESCGRLEKQRVGWIDYRLRAALDKPTDEAPPKGSRLDDAMLNRAMEAIKADPDSFVPSYTALTAALAAALQSQDSPT